MPAGFYLIIAAQFTSALADNALLIVAVARLQELGLPGWWAPLLKFTFTLSYVLLAPWVGPLADAVPKARLMAWMNALKFAGVVLLLVGVHPLLSFAVVGLAAAAYAPAKYGLITETVRPELLVAANGWIEVSIVCAVLLGTVTGGLLVSPWVLGAQWSSELIQIAQAAVPALHGITSLAVPVAVVLALYLVAGGLNLGIPDSGKRYPSSWAGPRTMLRDFMAGNRLLWADREGGLSLAVTTLFWGAGATLQFIVLKWAQDALGLGLDRAAYLQGVVAIGVVAGAAVAGRWIALHRATRVLPMGVAMGLLVPCMAAVDTLMVAVPLLAVIGACAGFFVVPMNALLQHRGCRLLTAGRSIAVQGYNENLSILAMLATYAALLAAGVGIGWLIVLLGLLVAAVMCLLILRDRRATPAPRARALDSPSSSWPT
ncbi:MAG: major facilitator transporter [Methylibium sp. NZG]|nr:MAG: major facilitator transporter [Methylibium sp. NZG]